MKSKLLLIMAGVLSASYLFDGIYSFLNSTNGIKDVIFGLLWAIMAFWYWSKIKKNK